MDPRPAPAPRNLQFRAGLLLGLTLMIAVGFVVYVLYARGVFEATQQLTLVADNAEGVTVGMDLTFSGFPIGRVYRIALADDGRARISIRVPADDARWLKTTSIFTLERGIVGAPRMRAFSGNLQDPPLPDGAERRVLRGDTSEEIPRLVATLRSTLQNLEEMTSAAGSLQASLGNVRKLSDRIAARDNVLGALLGSDEEAKKVAAAIERTNALLASLGGVSQKLDSVLARTDGMLGKVDQRMFGTGGVMDGAQRAVTETNAILTEVRESLKRADALLADAQKISGNVKEGTTDLAALRSEVESTLRKVGGLIEEINRKWPFQRETEIKLP
jgi:phospholipid/cholesterol/gamma-HCH transport system substrate-binding protein